MIHDDARYEAEAACFRRVDLLASEDEMRGGAHSNQMRQCNHRDRGKASELDFRLAKLRGFRSKNAITKGCEFHAAAKTVTVDSGDCQAVGCGEPAEYSVKRGEHFLGTFGSVIGDFRSRGETLGARALKNHHITLAKNALQHRTSRLHH